MLSKFNVSAIVKSRECEGIRRGFIILPAPGVPSTPPAKIQEIHLKNLVKITTSKTKVPGCYNRHIEKLEESCTIGQFHSQIGKDASPFNMDDFYQHLENGGTSVYPQDCEGTLFAQEDNFNLSLEGLPNLLAKCGKLWDGINIPMLYIGSKFAYSSLHLEDMMLFSLFYLHSGGNKRWLIVKPADCYKLMEALKKAFPDDAEKCGEFFRHKSINVNEEFLNMHKIRFEVVIQEPGQIIITYPMAWHQVVNEDANIGEAVNFCTPLWLDIAKLVDRCKCQDPKHVIWFDWHILARTNTEERKAEYLENFFGQYDDVSPFIGSSSSIPSSSSNVVPSPPPPQLTKKYFCVPCNKPCRDNNDLKRHLSSNIHTAPSFECNICHGMFPQKSSLDRHKRSQHPS